MDLQLDIQNMFEEIINYSGNFGDPIATEYSFNPMSELESPINNQFVKLGVGVALLVDFMVYIDNNSYKSALSSQQAINITAVMEKNIFNNFPLIVNAMKAAFVSEQKYSSSLSEVYKEHIINWKNNA